MIDVALEALRSIAPTRSAEEFHASACEALRVAGFTVRREVLSPYDIVRVQGSRRGQVLRRRGRLDIVARYGSFSLAVECDREWPRRKSLAKLRGFPGHRVVLLREGQTMTPPPEFDAVIGFQDEQYEPEEACQMVGCGLPAGPEGVCCHCLQDIDEVRPSPSLTRRDGVTSKCDEAAVGGRLR